MIIMQYIARFLFISCILGFCIQISIAQDIRINELVSSNTIHADADGDNPDWFELYNYGSTSVSLQGWGVSDDESDLRKWVFPSIILEPQEHLLLWASSKDRYYLTFPRTLVNQGDNVKYMIPSSEPSSSWKTLDYDDSSWDEGATGIGYADGDDATLVPEGTKSVFLRKKFNINDLGDLLYLILDIDYDDGFVAYINNTEIARANIDGDPPPYNGPAIYEHEALMINGEAPERHYLVDVEDYITEGENVLCVQVHNTGTSSSDLSIIPFLTAIFVNQTNIGVTPPEVLNLPNRRFHTNFKLSSDGEDLFLSNAQEQIIDQLPATEAPTNISIGRSGNSNDMVFFVNTTPGYTNDENTYSGFLNNEITFSHPGGLLEGAVSLSLLGISGNQSIRYTTDGSIPNESSTVYTNSIQINGNTVIRASTFEENMIPSAPKNRTYILDNTHEIDMVLLTTDPYNLFDEDYGIYVPGPEGSYNPEKPYFGANFWEDWERPIHMAFYEKETGQLGVEFNAGVKIYGGWSRGQNEQRSLALYARKSYGDPKFEYPFFEEFNYNDFENVVLRNSGQDFLRSSIKDIAISSLMEGSGIDYQGYRPAATYINGEYWGMYHLREKVNEHTLASKFDINADDITLLTGNAQVVKGSNEEYIALMDYITNTNISNDYNFAYVEDQIDIKNYALYQATEIYINNGDWPSHNIKYWKHPDGKWRWILYDTDFGFGPYWETDDYDVNTLSFALEENGPNWPNPPWSTLLFRRLTTNTGFRNTFINRYADELNSRFLPESVKAHLVQISQSIQSEVEAHYTRWDGDPINQSYYVDEMKNWAENRPAFAKEHLMSQFQLPAMRTIIIVNEDIEEGFVKVNNNLKIQSDVWNGDYFETVPIELKAVPAFGYQFSHWSGASNSTEALISLNLESDISITPHFSPAQNLIALVINEINYKSSIDFDPGDWIEIYNPNPSIVDVSNWILKDNNDNNAYIIPDGTIIPSNGYLVITKNQMDFQAAFPTVSNFIGDLSFGLSSEADAIRLYSENEVLQDEVAYQAIEPWPICAAGNGPTLELISFDLDNSLAESWKCMSFHGSPGKLNVDASAVNEIANNTFNTYPNPVGDILYITGIKNAAIVKIYSLSGQELLVNSSKGQVDVSQINSGVYILDIIEDNKTSRHKLIKR